MAVCAKIKRFTKLHTMHKKGFVILIFMFSFQVFSQEVYYHTSNQQVYDFLDEMANLQWITLNSAIKPYSRKEIAEKLAQLDENRDFLNTRQKKELDFYLKDFGKELMKQDLPEKRMDLFYYKDSLFSITVNPILGIKYYANEKASFYHRWNGAEAFGYIGEHVGIYANIRDNALSKTYILPQYLDQHIGANYKIVDNGQEYNEFRGGITYGWDWGNIALMKDQFSWGNHYNGANIFSGKSPSYGILKLRVKPVRWLELNFIHGWLVSEVVDSTRSYWVVNNYGSTYRRVYHSKEVAANFLTLTPLRGISFSIGNAIVYSDLDFRPEYFIPIMFFKSADHTVNHAIDNQNSQMFFDLSIRKIKNLHLYTSVFIDEISLYRMFKKSEHSNFVSFKGGFKLSDYPLQNMSFTLEYTRTNPLTYRHPTNTIDFASNRYTMGHYLKDNADEMYASIDYKPLKGLSISSYFLHARKGKDHTVLGTDRHGIPFMDSVEWEDTQLGFSANWQIVNDAYISFEVIKRNVRGNNLSYTAPMFHGKTQTISLGANIGF